MHYLKLEEDGSVTKVHGEPYVSRTEILRPWALRGDDVVYADWDKRSYGMQGIFDLAFSGMRMGRAHGPLRSYDKNVSQKRRREFESKLAQDAAINPSTYSSAVNKVSLSIIQYVEGTGEQDRILAAGNIVKARCYGDTISGRLGSKGDGASLSAEDAWTGAKGVLMQGKEIAKILGIQSAMATKLIQQVPLGAERQKLHDSTASRVAPTTGYLHTWFDPKNRDRDGQLRGRQKGSGSGPTSAPGLMPSGTPGNEHAEARVRGIDTWEPVEGSGFVKGINMRNLVFGAGRSGTTGSLLITYRTFGDVDDGEEFKKYLLAIVVYLVSGGHHSCHEIFSIANLLIGGKEPRNGRAPRGISDLVKEAYVPGKYLKHLPADYVDSAGFERLREKYYDIAVLGHLHGTFV